MEMVEDNKVNVKLSDLQINKLKFAFKSETGASWRMNIKIFEGNKLPHELLLKTREENKLRNAVKNNM